MAYCVSHMIGIRVGGVFSGSIDAQDMRERIKSIILSLRNSKNDPDIGGKDGDPSHCMSRELEAHKGSYIVLAGVFNYWDFSQASVFVKRLSEEFGTEVMHMAWDEEKDDVQCQIWLAGKPLAEVAEHPLFRIMRRIT